MHKTYASIVIVWLVIIGYCKSGYSDFCCLCHSKDRQMSSCQRKTTFLLQGGLYRGSIVGKNKVDAVSGATKSAFGGSVAAEWKIKGNYIQGGFTIGKTDQQIDYNDIATGIIGRRNVSMLLLDVPILYDFHMFPRYSEGRDCPWMIIGLGGFGSFVLSKDVNETGHLESKKLSSWAAGPFLKFAVYPFELRRFQPGLYLDFYRSLLPNFYDDPYFKANAMAGQLGIINMGLSIRF